MSWDVLLIKTETNDEELENITCPVPFDRDSFISIVKSEFPLINCKDPSWFILADDNYSIEFNIGEQEPVQTIMLHIRGGTEPLDVIYFLCSKLNCRAYDTSSSAFIEHGKETGFKDWKQFRDKVVGEINAPKQ